MDFDVTTPFLGSFKPHRSTRLTIGFWMQVLKWLLGGSVRGNVLNSRRAGLYVVTYFFALYLLPGNAFGQSIAPSDTRSTQSFSGGLLDAVALTLLNDSAVSGAKQRVLGSLGAITSAKSPFDTVLTVDTEATRRVAPLTLSQQVDGVSKAVTNNVAYGANVLWRTHSGVALNTSFIVTRAQDNTLYSSGQLKSELSINVIYPLLKGSSVSANTLAERTAQLALESAQLAQAQFASAAVAKTVNAYWDLVAERELLAVLQSSVTGSEQLLNNARRLAKADEIPRADLLKYEAKLARDRFAELSQLQATNQAATNLHLAMGLPASNQNLAPSTTLDKFPSIATFSTESLEFLEKSEPLVTQLVEKRSDLRILDRQRQISEVLLSSAQSNPGQQLDLKVGAGVSGLVENRSPLAPWSALRTNSSPNLSIGIYYSIPLQGNARRGDIAQLTAAASEAVIAYDGAERSAKKTVAELVARIRELHALRSLASMQVDLQQRVTDAERKRFGANLLTTFELFASEEQLTQERVVAINAERRLAQAIATLRFEMGLILFADSANPLYKQFTPITMSRLTQLPGLQEITKP